MSENLHDIDKLFQDSIEGHAETPPPAVWQQLDKKLDQKKAASIAGRYRMLKWVAAALFLISAGMAMWVYNLQTNKKGDLVKKTETRLSPASGGVANDPDGSTNEQEPAPIKQADKEPIVQQHGVTTPASSGSGEKVSVKEKRMTDDTDTSPGETRTETMRQQSMPKDAVPLPMQKTDLRNAIAKKINKKNAAAESYVSGIIPAHAGDIINEQLKNKQIKPGTGEEGLLVAVVGEPVRHTRSSKVDISTLPPPGPGSLVPALARSGAAATVKLAPLHAGFTATVFFSPNLVSNSITNNNLLLHNNEDKKDTIKGKEQNRTSKSIGALIEYNINQHWSIGSGIILSTRTTEIKAKPIYAREDQRRGGEVRYRFNCSSGYFYINPKPGRSNPPSGDTIKALSSLNTLKYLSVPLSLKYTAGEGKLRLVTSAGLQANFLTDRNIETVITKGAQHENASTSDNQGLRPVYFSGVISAGATYKLNRIVTASVVPTAQLGFMSITHDNPVKSYINFYGLALGLSIKL